MSETQVSALDHTIQQTNAWLKALAEEHRLGNRPHAYSALRAVLHALRDRLTPEQAVHLGAQLPLLVRGIYYAGWRPAGTPDVSRRLDDFEARIAQELPYNFPVDTATAARAVFAVIWREIDFNETAKVVSDLPTPLRELWPEEARSLAAARTGE
ncbi:DUF2267 domain-containing protein [Methylocystis echinoides]|jgi:uncharacterized protein (DUF2267 family)|uniref:DUF2267 domain-containing protein n=1 Tax=Methylocystis echinoides TaxID=29468 RepID=UPI00341FF45C